MAVNYLIHLAIFSLQANIYDDVAWLISISCSACRTSRDKTALCSYDGPGDSMDHGLSCVQYCMLLLVSGLIPRLLASVVHFYRGEEQDPEMS